MSRIHIESQTHNLCEGHGCCSTTSNQCKSHKKNLCNNCTALFHYQCDLKIRNAERFIKAATKIIDKQVDEIEKKGREYGLDREYVEYGDCVRDAKEKVEEFKSRLRDEENKEEREDGCVRDCRKVLQDVLESQAYHLFQSYKCKLSLISSSPSPQIHESSYDSAISKTLRSLTFEILSKTESTLDNKLKEVKKELKKQIKETNDRIDCKEKENSDKFEEIERKFQLTESEKIEKNELEETQRKLSKKIKEMRRKQDAK